VIRIEWTYSVAGAPVSGFSEGYTNAPRLRAFEALEAHLAQAGVQDVSPLAELVRWLVRVQTLDLKDFRSEEYVAPGVRVKFSIP